MGILHNNVHVVDNTVHCTLGNCRESEFYFWVANKKKKGLYNRNILPIHKALLTISRFSHVSLTLLDIKTTLVANLLIKHSFKIIKRTGLRLFFIFNKYQAVVLFPDYFYFSRNLPEHDPPTHRNMGVYQKASKDRFWEDSLTQCCPVETEHKLKLYM